MMTITAECQYCGKVVKPTVFNHPACEARCPECGEWFCWSDTSGRKYDLKPVRGAAAPVLIDATAAFFDMKS